MSPSSIDPFAKPSANARYLRIPAEDRVDVKGSLRIATMTPHVVPLAAIGLQLILLERAFLVAHRELAEAWGYQYGWAVIVLSALIPLVWLKVKGWF
jgi:hypothetical protein